MTNQHSFEDQGKVQPKPEHEEAAPSKTEGPVTLSEIGGKLSPDTITRMQKTVGNAAVQRFLAQRSAEGTSDVDEETASTINSKRGAGHSLDENIAGKAGQAMGHDFSDVSVHTDSQSDQLNKQLGAKAFTTGSDIYFSDGAYSPGSSDGQRLISHELTHVVQQSGNTSPGQGKMSVNDPNDKYEGEADSAADSVMNISDEDFAQRQAEEEEEPVQAKLQRQDEEEMMQMQPIEEEEEMLQPKLQRQEEEEMQMQEEEEMQMQEEEELQMQPVEEEEPVQAKLQRQEEEEMMQMQPIEEEEEMLQPKLQRQEEEEGEEIVATKLQRQEEEEMMQMQPIEEEEEMLQPKLQRQEEEEMQMQEEEEVQASLQRQEELPEEEI